MKRLALIAVSCIMILLGSGCAGSLSMALPSDHRKAAVAYAALGEPGGHSPAAAETEGLTPVGENAYLQLYYRESTATVSVFDRRSGTWWHSDPADENGTLSAEAKSQISMDTVDRSGVVRHYASYDGALLMHQVQFAAADGRLTVTYTFGNTGPDLTGIPRKLTGERYTALADRMDAEGKKRLKARYEYDESTDVWTLKEKNLTKDMTDKLKQALDSIGYSEQELAADHAATGVEVTEEGSGQYVFPLTYILQDDSLLVRIDGEGMQIPKNEYVTSLNVLKYFGCLSAGEEGYLLIPDGSGALVDTSPVKGSVGLYKQRVYGPDEAMSSTSQGSNRQQEILLPVFGISRPAGGMLAIIEDSEAAAAVEATGVGYLDDLATVGASFEINAAEDIGLSASDRSTFWVSTESRYPGNAEIRYVFLAPEESDYSGMAACYRRYLQRYGGLRPMEDASGDLPLFMETVGAVSTQVSTAGFLHDADVALTAYEDHIAMLQQLSARGVDTVNVLLTGWMDGGIDQPLADEAALMKELGGERGFRALTAYAAQSGGQIRLYPEVLLGSMSPEDSLWDRSRYAALTLGQKKSILEQFDIVTGQQEDEDLSRTLVSPNYWESLTARFLASFGRLEVGGLCIGDLAKTAHSDHNNKQEVLRQYALMRSGDILKTAAQEAGSLLLRSPNNVTAPLSRVFSDVPASSGSYFLSSRSVPFYQLVFHGAADYAMSDLNSSADLREGVLRCVEYGACPKFKFTYRKDDRLRLGEYHWLKAADFGRWLEQTAESYAYIEQLLSPVRSAEMLRHEQLAEGAYAVEYGNGYTICVNYGTQAVTWQDVTIPARDAVIRKTGGGS